MQEFKDKIGLEKRLQSGEKIILEFGCGRKARKDRITIDILDLPEADIVTSLEEGLTFLPDNSVDEIHSTSFFEHIDNFEFLMKEVHRVLKRSGIVSIFVPHFSNPYYYSDSTHKRFFGYYTFYYFTSDQSKIKRKVPSFYDNPKFKIDSQKLYFTSAFKFLRELKILFGKLINSSTWLQEFYEGHLVNIISCYGIDIELSPEKDSD